MKRAVLILSVATFVAPGPAGAFQPLVTDDTGTQGAGGNQVEIAYNRSVSKVPGERTVQHELPLVYTRGITDALDLFLGVLPQRLEPPSPASSEAGWSNAVIGAKWRFYENESARLSLGLKPELRLPVSQSREARGLGSARTGYALALIATRETAFGALHANVALEKIDYADPALDAAERRTRHRASIAPVWDVTQVWKLALDAGWMTNPDPGARRYLGYVEIGAIHAPTKDLELAAGVVRHFRDSGASTTRATLGLTWRFR